MNVKNRSYLNVKYIFSLSLLMMLIGCSTLFHVGNDFDIALFESKAIAGETNKQQVRSWLGEPKSNGISQNTKGERLEEWGYLYGTGQIPGMKDTKLKILQIRFDKEGVLRSYNWSDSK